MNCILTSCKRFSLFLLRNVSSKFCLFTSVKGFDYGQILKSSNIVGSMMQKFFAPLRRMSQINRLCCCVENEDNLTLQERDHYVGIQENVGQHRKLNALMKHRYSKREEFKLKIRTLINNLCNI